MSLVEKSYNVIGLMSGTSLDGLDIAFCTFVKTEKDWNFELKMASTIQYKPDLVNKLKNSIHLSGLELSLLDIELGCFIGNSCDDFISKNELSIDFISSHGHTIFHQPNNGLTLQIGSGSSICSRTNTPVVCDFRTMDVAYGGQGAPLVPVGDKLLFSQYDSCVNLGGFANISFEKNEQSIAYDVCPVNIVLNWLAEKLNLDYDKDGEIAKSGKIIPELLEQLNSLPYYFSTPPKSLGKEWSDETIIPLLDPTLHSVPDLLKTYTEHTAIQIAAALNNEQLDTALFTGGGTFNQFLIERIRELSNTKIVIPNSDIINFKEAIIFAFLGVLRWEKQINCLSSVTGAKKDNIGGAVYLP
ncbi:MAG: anhydro-N-acetylmuramic acid kinase [Flavobacteriales bacterium]|nr:anhydro-N-acetylmuramic acid kinase [Flavobacteriales bacterium]